MANKKYNITKFPVIILSAPRTGSTALLYELNDSPDLTIISEPLNSANLSEENNIDFIKSLLSDTKRCIVKVHIHDLYTPKFDKTKIIQDILLNYIRKNNAFLIRIRRKDVIAQITSYYISMTRNIWSAPANSILPSTIHDPVPIIPSQLALAVHVILSCNKSLNEFTRLIDIDVWYEEADFPVDTVVQITKPENYLEIYKILETMLRPLKGYI
jgi:hypothetical protein